MGAPFIDHLIADRIVIPEHHREFYSENVVFMPNSYQINDSRRPIADTRFSRAELGLPPEGFVFCCFNNAYKITPDVFDCWMRILKRVPHSVLWLLESNATATGNLRKEAAAREVDAARLIFARHMPSPDHLARHRAADLCLDTLPYNAHTTASDALWAGKPILTCIGETFAGRVAASLLYALRLPELVTTTLRDYEELAVELATRPEKLAAIHHKLADNRDTTSLFDTKRFTKHIETAFSELNERYRAGLMPSDLFVLD
jgi:protein O-GlcNAc transferase